MGSRWSRNRASAFALTVAFLLAARVLMPDPLERANAIYLAVIALGYGHLIGPLVFRKRRSEQEGASARGSVWLGRGVIGLGLPLSFALYLYGLETWPWVALLMLAISTWHTVENDLSLRQIYERGPGAGPARPVVSAFVAFVPAIAVVAIFAQADALDLSRALLYPEIFTASTLYHLISWLIVFLDRAAVSLPHERRRIYRRLLVAHVPAAAAVLWLSASSAATLEPLRILATAPGVYQFFGALHVAQTLLGRRRKLKADESD